MSRLPREEWLQQAQSIAVGRKLRIRHTCGTSPSMDVYNNVDSWSAWCFRCKGKGWVPKEHQRLRGSVVEPDRIQPIPEDTVPLAEATPYEQRQCWSLLVQKGCPPGVIPEELLWFSRSAQRIMLLSQGRAVGRAIHPERLPKWLMFGAWQGSAKLWVTRAPAEGMAPAPGARSTWALTEDALSAYKVAKAIELFAPSSSVCVAATLGTACTERVLPLLMNSDVINMYDGDPAGLSGFQEMRKRLSVFGCAVLDRRPVEGDPKEKSLEAIWESLSK